jgi:hypothetical protein
MAQFGGPLAALRSWARRRAAPLGVPLAALLILIVLMLFGLPIGPAEPLTGVVERLGNTSGRGGNLIAFVRVRDGSIMEVSITQDDQCQPGNLIRFHLQKHLIGAMAIAGFVPCTTSSNHPL